MNNGNWGCQAHEQGQMKFLSIRKNANEVHKHKIKGKLCWKAQKQPQKQKEVKNYMNNDS